MLGPLREHKNDRGYVLIVVVLMMLVMAVMAAGMNRRAAMQARVTANQILNSQVHLGQIAALQQAAWTLSRHPSWRTSGAGDIFRFSGIDYNLTVLDSSMADFSNVVTVTVKAPGGSKDFTTSFRIIPQKRLYYLIADAENNVIRSVDTTTGTITTFAGNGTPGFLGEGGPATDAQLDYPTGLWADQAGNVFIADTMNHRIMKVDPQGIITRVAGKANGDGGNYSQLDDNGLATSAALNQPEGVAVDGLGNIYIADTQNHCIRMVDKPSGTIIPYAGKCGVAGYKMDGGPAKNAEFNEPQGLYVDASGNLFIADTGNCMIRKVEASTQIIWKVTGAVSGTTPICGYSESDDGGQADEAKLDKPHGVYVDKDEDIYIADEDNHRIRKVDSTTGIITTIAGDGFPAYGGDGGPAVDASMQNPKSVWVDVNGDVLIADNENNRIRKVTVTTGDISTAAGNGIAGYWGDHGPAIDARLKKPHGVCGYESPAPVYLYFSDPSNYQIRRVDLEDNFLTKAAGTIWVGYNGDNILATWANLNYPFGVHVDASGNVLIADTYNHRIRKVNAKTGIITTVAGNGSKGFSGDGGPATSARVRYPFSVYGDSVGNIYIADTYNYRIRKVNAKTGIITTVAGDGSAKFRGDGGLATEASIAKAYDLAVDSEGNLYIADTHNHCIRKVDVTTEIINTVVGQGTKTGFSGDGGLATDALLNTPTGVCVDASGNIYLTDTKNDVVRKVDAATQIINTIAGNGTPGFSGDGGPATQAKLDYPEGVWVDSSGNIFIVDTNNCRIRMVDGNTGIITTVAGTSSCGYNGNNQPATEAALYYPSDISVYEPSSIEWLPQIYRQSN